MLKLKRMTTFAGALFSLLALSSCSLFSPVPSQSTSAYVINTTPCNIGKESRQRTTLFVAPMEADPIYNTTAMAYTTKPYQIAYFGKNSWAEPPAAMIQPLIIQTLQNTHHFRAVNGGSSIGNYDYILKTQLLELQQAFLSNTSIVHLKIRAQIINANNGQVMATKQFSVSEMTAQKTPYSGVVATNRATAVILEEIARFCLNKI